MKLYILETMIVTNTRLVMVVFNKLPFDIKKFKSFK